MIDLKTVLDAAVINDADVQISAIDRNISKLRIDESTQALYPNAYIGGSRFVSQSQITGVPGGQFGVQTFPVAGYSLGISQTIYNPSIFRQLDASRKNSITSEWLHQRALRDTQLKVVKTFLELAYLQQALTISAAAYEDISHEQKSAVFSPRGDDSQKIIRPDQTGELLNLSQTISVYKSNIRLRRQQLSNIIGKPFETVFEPPCLQAQASFQRVEISALSGFDPENHLDFIIKRSSFEQTLAEKPNSKLPDGFSITFSANLSQNIGSPLYPGARVTGVTHGLQLNLPLNGFIVKSAVERSLDFRIERDLTELRSIKGRVSHSVLEIEEEIQNNIRYRNLLIQSLEVEQANLAIPQDQRSAYVTGQSYQITQLQSNLLRLQAELVISLIKRQWADYNSADDIFLNPCSLLKL